MTTNERIVALLNLREKLSQEIFGRSPAHISVEMEATLARYMQAMHLQQLADAMDRANMLTGGLL